MHHRHSPARPRPAPGPQALVWLAAFTVLVAGCRERIPDVAFGGVERVRPTQPSDARGAEVRVGRTYGAGPEPAFAFLGSLAVLSDGRLAAADNGTCEILVFPTSPDEAVHRLGRCGDGPGELREVRGLTASGDTLIAYDPSKQALVWITLDGAERRRMRPDILVDSAAVMGLTGIAVVNDTVLVAGLILPPAEERDTDDRLLALIDTRTGRTLQRFLVDPPVSQRNPGNLLRTVEFCLTRTDSGAFLSTINHWAFEGVTWRVPELEQVGHFRVSLPWTGPIRVDRDPPGMLRMASGYATVGCSHQGTLYRHHRLDQSSKPIKRLGGRIELRDFDGTLRFAADLDAGDWRLTGRFAAGGPQSVFATMADPVTSAHIVREIEIVQSPSTDRSAP